MGFAGGTEIRFDPEMNAQRAAFEPAPAPRENVQLTMPIRAAVFVHAEDRRTTSETHDLPRQSVASRHASAKPTDARAGLAHEARHRRLGNAEFSLDLLPAQKPALH